VFADITTFPCRIAKSIDFTGKTALFKQATAQLDFSINELQNVDCSARINRGPSSAKWRGEPGGSIQAAFNRGRKWV